MEAGVVMRRLLLLVLLALPLTAQTGLYEGFCCGWDYDATDNPATPYDEHQVWFQQSRIQVVTGTQTGTTITKDPATGRPTLTIHLNTSALDSALEDLSGEILALKSTVTTLTQTVANQSNQIQGLVDANAVLAAKVQALENASGGGGIPPPPTAELGDASPEIWAAGNLDLFVGYHCGDTSPCTVDRWNFDQVYRYGCHIELPNPVDPGLNGDLLVVADRNGWAVHDLAQTLAGSLTATRIEDGEESVNQAGCDLFGAYAGPWDSADTLDRSPMYLVRVTDGRIEQYGEWYAAPGRFWLRNRLW